MAKRMSALPGGEAWPRVWMSYRPHRDFDTDAADLKAHGVGLISRHCETVADARQALADARRLRLKYEIHLPEITERADLVRQAGLTPVDALMIGGVYRGRAVDRHVFRFAPGPQDIVIEPPVYNATYAYARRGQAPGAGRRGEKIAHYFPDIGPPTRAEVVVPLRAYDGRAHLKILSADIEAAPRGARPEADSVGPDLPPSSETRGRRLYRLRFDLTGLDKAQLGRVGLAVYWPYHGTDKYWIFGRGNVSAWAESTRAALRRQVGETLALWSEANGGRFPGDVVFAARFGDECFYITSHLNGTSVSYPLWDYSAPARAAFQRRAACSAGFQPAQCRQDACATTPRLEYPRTWGFPEVYGAKAYAWWRYVLHEGAARLAGLVREEIAARAPGLLLFRNTTRLGVFHMSNDHDGTGQELLTQNLDLVHLDPYPVSGRGYEACIPRDMSYCAGLARRYRRPLVPWMQAHVYGGPRGLQHPAPEQVDRMAEEQWRHGPDAVMWLGYGRRCTFPGVNPKSWERAGAFHRRLLASPPPKPRARLAVLRSYTTWALCSLHEGRIRNPADWLLQQLLEVWAVRHGQAYDVFEVPPALSPARRKALAAALKAYPFVVSTEPRRGAWVIGAGTLGTEVDPATAPRIQDEFEAELRSRGWLDGKRKKRKKEEGKRKKEKPGRRSAPA